MAAPLLPHARLLFHASRALDSTASRNHVFVNELSRRWMGTGSRGARGHGWYVKYRGAVPAVQPPAAAPPGKQKGGSGGGGAAPSKTKGSNAIEEEEENQTMIANRHLQHEYVEGRMSSESAARWNEAVLSLGSTAVFLDLSLSHHQHGPEESHRLVIDLATTVMPDSTGTFIDLLPKYVGTKLGRYEKQVAWCGGSNFLTPKPGQVELPDPRPLWHLPGTLSMVQRDCLNGQFLVLTHASPHLDGIHMAVGTVRDVECLQKWATTLLTVRGVPTAHDIIVHDAGLLLSEATP